MRKRSYSMEDCDTWLRRLFCYVQQRLCAAVHSLRSIHHFSIDNCRGILCYTYFLKLIQCMCACVCAQLSSLCAAYTTFQSATVVASSVALTFSSSSSACVHVSVHDSPHFAQHTPRFNQQLSWHPLLHLLSQAHPVHVCMCLCTTLHTLRSIHHVSINKIGRAHV